MGKSAAKRGTTTADPLADEMAQFMEAQAAKNQFLAATANLGFRLAITVVIPIVAGVKLDERFHSSPSWTLTGLFLAVFAGSGAVWGTIKQVNQQQAEMMSKKPRRKTKRA